MEIEKIKTEDLKIIFNNLIEYIENDLDIKELPLDVDYYYDVDYDEKYNILSKPKEFSVGQLYDDWEFIKPVLQDKGLATPSMLMHLAKILEYFSTQHDWFGVPKDSSNP